MRLVILYLGRRGAGPMYSYEFAKALLDKRISILAIISANCENIQLWKKLENEYELLTLKVVSTYNNISEFILYSCNVFKYFNIIKSIKLFAPNYVLVTMVHPWHNLILANLSSKIKIIKVIHDVNVHLGERNIFSNILSWIDLKISDKFIVLSEYSKNELIKRIGNNKQIVIIPHAEFGIYKTLNNVTNNKLQYRIGFIGRINKYKGLNILLKAFEKLLIKNKELKLLIAGNGDCTEFQDYFKNLQDYLELEIRWIADDEMSNIISKVDIIVLPYIEATQSGVIPLAFSYGKPVIVTNVGGIPEQVPIGTGIIIPPNDCDILAETLANLYDNPIHIANMGINAKKYSDNNLTWDASATKLINFLK